MNKRIEILNSLHDIELPVGEPADVLSIPAANVSQHLAIMRQKGILASRREGTNIYYKVGTQRLFRHATLCVKSSMSRSRKVGK